MENKRLAGVLLPVFSLPCKYGIGDFGTQAYRFIDKLSDSGVIVWQILPLNPLGYGNSPYQPLSSNAGDEIYIDLEALYEQGLITSLPQPVKTTKVDYEAVRIIKQTYLKQAFNNFVKNEEYEKFVKENNWVNDYANFASRTKNDGFWLNWIDKNDFSIKYQNDFEYEIFLQFMFYKQWLEIKKYANDLGIQIMGDIPIYVGINSVDVWINKDYFLLDEDCSPNPIAGVPPDYFSETGQRWGNPIYNWEYLKANKFDFFINRLVDNVAMYDILRIDHFRALDTYYVIDAKYDDAKIGKWLEAPGHEFFEELYNQQPNINIVVEDLGDLRPEVHQLRDDFNLPGMKIIQFTFDPNENNNDFEDRKNMIIYTGTHDNQTIMGWYKKQIWPRRRKIKKFFKANGYSGKVHEMFLSFCLDSIADMAIIPVQDIIGLNDKARINTPGTIGSPNWEYKFNDLDCMDFAFLKQEITRTNR